LVFTAQPPTSVKAGAALAVAVTAETDAGDPDTGYRGNITLAIANNPNHGALSGTVTLPVQNGVATFTGLSIDKAGSGCTLQATSSPALTSATSNGFVIVASDPANITATSIGFQTATVTTPFANPLVATVTDRFGNPEGAGIAV